MAKKIIEYQKEICPNCQNVLIRIAISDKSKLASICSSINCDTYMEIRNKYYYNKMANQSKL